MDNSIICGNEISPDQVRRVIEAFRDQAPITGSTHGFYKYPARFSPQFAAAVIENFSSPGDIVLDPFMGGGTSIVEAKRLGRIAVGSDVNALSVFLARVKTSVLTRRQTEMLELWGDGVVPSLRFADELEALAGQAVNPQLKNMNLPQARFIKKLTALALQTVVDLPDAKVRSVARCALLSAGQWALHGRRHGIDSDSFRERVQLTMHSMIAGLAEYAQSLPNEHTTRSHLSRRAAEEAHLSPAFSSGRRASLVVTSPPYPGIHILYHRWQVAGRRETPAPYWITATRDGRGNAYYNLGDRRSHNSDDYFERLVTSFAAVRNAMLTGANLVQIVAFAKPGRDLPRYLSAMEECGFEDTSPIALENSKGARVWRSVPRRAWHATMKGAIEASREVLLIHRAV